MVSTYNAKAVLLGDPAVGKTSIRRRYMGEGFQTSKIMMTIGADFAQSKIKVDDQNSVSMQIWDVAGQDEFERVRSRFLINANICLMVFDLTRKETFLNINKWMQDFWEINPRGKIPLLIIANKSDLEGMYEVETQEIENMIELLKKANNSTSSHISYIVTSAATGHNISKAFNRVSRQIIKIFNEAYSK